MNQNPDPSQPREPDPPGYAPHSSSYYGNLPMQPGTTDYYHNSGMQQGQPGPNPGYPVGGAGFPPPPGYMPPPPGYIPPPPSYMPPPPFMNGGMPPMYPAPKKKRTWLWVLIGSAIVLFVLLLSACGVFFSSILQIAKSSSTSSYSQQLHQEETQTASSDSTSNSDTSSSDTSSSSSSTDTGGASTVVNIGQKITSNGVDCTVVSVQKIDGDSYAQPDAGNQLIVVHVKLENHSSQKQAYNVFDFHSISKGQAHIEFIFTPSAYTANNRLHYGELLPGATVEGDIFFQVPIDDHQVKVSWEPTWVYSETQYEWNLGL